MDHIKIEHHHFQINNFDFVHLTKCNLMDLCSIQYVSKNMHGVIFVNVSHTCNGFITVITWRLALWFWFNDIFFIHLMWYYPFFTEIGCNSQLCRSWYDWKNTPSNSYQLIVRKIGNHPKKNCQSHEIIIMM